MPLAKVNGINMYYELHGRGEQFVLISGLGSDLSNFRELVRRLAKRYQVLAFDNRGAGRTDKPDAPYTIEMMADDAGALMDLAGVGPAHVMGISMGGRIALGLALRHPEKVRSLVLVSTFARQAAGSASARRIRRLNIINRIPVVKYLFSRHPQPAYAFERQLKASRSYDCSARLGEIHVPALVLHGRGDRVAPLELSEEMQAGIGGSKMITFPGGHMFFMGRLDDFCRTVFDFLSCV